MTGLQSFSIIAVEANTAMRTIHDRMSAILSPQEYDEWFDRGEVERPPTHLLRPFPKPRCRSTPLTPRSATCATRTLICWIRSKLHVSWCFERFESRNVR